MSSIRSLLTALFVSTLVITLSGCEKQGPLEEAGEEVDEAIQDAGDAIEDAGDDVRRDS